MTQIYETRRASLVEVLDRTLRTGVAIQGDLVISVAGVDLIGLDLRIILAAAGRIEQHHRADQLHRDSGALSA